VFDLGDGSAPYKMAIDLDRFQVIDLDTRFQCHPIKSAARFQVIHLDTRFQSHLIKSAACSVHFIFCHIDVAVDHSRHVTTELQKRVVMAALVLGQTSITAAGMQQILGSVAFISTCSRFFPFFFHFNLLAFMTMVCCGDGAD
jgi:hypothetical protein